MFFSPLSISIHANRIIEFETQKNANAGNQDAGTLKDVIDIQAIQSPESLKAEQIFIFLFLYSGWVAFIYYFPALHSSWSSCQRQLSKKKKKWDSGHIDTNELESIRKAIIFFSSLLIDWN